MEGAQAGRPSVPSCLGCGQGSPGEAEEARVLRVLGQRFWYRITEEVRVAGNIGWGGLWVTGVEAAYPCHYTKNGVFAE